MRRICNTLGLVSGAFVCSLLIDLPFALAQTADAGAPAQAAGAAPGLQHTPFQFILSSVNFFLIAFFVYYVLVLRPSQLKNEQQARFLRDLKKDDDIVTSGGILGRVASIQPDFIGVEIASGTRIRVRPENVLPLQPAKAAGAESRTKPAEKEKERKSK